MSLSSLAGLHPLRNQGALQFGRREIEAVLRAYARAHLEDQDDIDAGLKFRADVLAKFERLLLTVRPEDSPKIPLASLA